MHNDYKHLSAWCAEYSKKTGVKIYPQSAPLQLVLEDMVGEVISLRSRVKALEQALQHKTTEEKVASKKKEVKA